MKIQTFKNGKGIIHGNDPKRIGCDIKSGLLKIGNTEIKIPYGEDAIMPSLFHGATGDYNATFTDEQGTHQRRYLSHSRSIQFSNAIVCRTS